MKKILIVATIALLGLSSNFSSPCWASDSDVPDTAVLLATGQVNFAASVYRSNYYGICTKSKDYLVQIATAKTIKSDGPYSSSGYNNAGPFASDQGFNSSSFNVVAGVSDILNDIELACQNVYYKWDYRESSTGGLFDYSSWYGIIGITVYCEPRAIQQKQIMSLERFCEHQPNEKCFDKDYLDYLGKLAPTNYKNINSVDCQI